MPVKSTDSGPSCQASNTRELTVLLGLLTSSILTVIFCAHFTLQRFIATGGKAPIATVGLFGKHKASSVWDTIEPRLALVLALEVLWSARLTFNAYRRGMFKK